LMETIDKAKLCLKIILERKAEDPVLFEVGKLTSMTDYFLVVSGQSSRQVQSLYQHLLKGMKKAGFKIRGVEGEQQGHWILMDYGDVIVHIFYQPFRELYDLESLWIEAPRVSIEG